MSDSTTRQLEHFKNVMEPTPPFLEALIAERRAHQKLRAWIEGLRLRVDSAGGGSAVTFRKAIFLDEITRILEGDDG